MLEAHVHTDGYFETAAVINGVVIERLKVPGGWLYMTIAAQFNNGSFTGNVVTQTFVADPPTATLVYLPLTENDKILGGVKR
jgi:hypothetical protein